MKKQYRRRVHRILPAPLGDGTFVFRSKSMTRDDGTLHHCTVNPQTGYVNCTCEAQRFAPGTSKFFITGEGHCKHLAKAIATVKAIYKNSK